jgi:hypothetical protein
MQHQNNSFFYFFTNLLLIGEHMLPRAKQHVQTKSCLFNSAPSLFTNKAYIFSEKSSQVKTFRGFPLKNNLYALSIVNVILVMSEKGGTYLCRHLSMHMASTTINDCQKARTSMSTYT